MTAPLLGAPHPPDVTPLLLMMMSGSWCHHGPGLQAPDEDVFSLRVSMITLVTCHDGVVSDKHHPLAQLATDWLQPGWDQLALLCVHWALIGWRNSCSAPIGWQPSGKHESGSRQLWAGPGYKLPSWARACDVLWWWASLGMVKVFPTQWPGALSNTVTMTGHWYPVQTGVCH